MNHKYNYGQIHFILDAQSLEMVKATRDHIHNIVKVITALFCVYIPYTAEGGGFGWLTNCKIIKQMFTIRVALFC